jgi:hypothetical protein
LRWEIKTDSHGIFGIWKRNRIAVSLKSSQQSSLNNQLGKDLG